MRVVLTLVLLVAAACNRPDYSAAADVWGACTTTADCTANGQVCAQGICVLPGANWDGGLARDVGSSADATVDAGTAPDAAVDVGAAPDAGQAGDASTPPDAGPNSPNGSTALRAAQTCTSLHAAYPDLPSGTYWIDPDGAGGTAPYQARCDMETLGGGWTIVKRWGSGQYYSNSLFMSRTNAMGRSQTAQGSVTEDTYAVPYEGGIDDSNQVLLGWSFTGNSDVERATGYVHWSATLSEFNPASDRAQSCAETGFWTRTQGGCEYSNGNDNVLGSSSNFTLSSWLIGDLEGTGTDWCSSRAWDDDAGLTQPNPQGEPSGNIQCPAYDDGHIWIAVRAVNDAPDGSSADNAALNCATLHTEHPNLPSGTYWIAPGVGGAPAFETYCDMTTDGGGWSRCLNMGARDEDYVAGFLESCRGFGAGEALFKVYAQHEGESGGVHTAVYVLTMSGAIDDAFEMTNQADNWRIDGSAAYDLRKIGGSSSSTVANKVWFDRGSNANKAEFCIGTVGPNEHCRCMMSTRSAGTMHRDGITGDDEATEIFWR